MCILQQNLTDQDRFAEPPTAGNPPSRGQENPSGLRHDLDRQDPEKHTERRGPAH
ncbi:hypothetical protein SAMN05421833_14540 [Microbispora rosea]|uniref:Uncharacterized protein n=1 Tax=Microbispora rosea TaxID=58117 RepID=A0A1N7HE90_9ACTN|nr:hypothetical protein Mro03_78080 [Microbispora rosea subsp. rosea]SIS23010.1 hypothetical protein SAMN05421833_14540 [Microbispora rosea]